MVRKREVYATAFNMPYWISKIGKVNQKTKENLIYNLYIFFSFPSVTKQFCSMGMYWYNFQITAFTIQLFCSHALKTNKPLYFPSGGKKKQTALLIDSVQLKQLHFPFLRVQVLLHWKNKNTSLVVNFHKVLYSQFKPGSLTFLEDYQPGHCVVNVAINTHWNGVVNVIR